MKKINIEEYNKAIQDINNQNFADYCNKCFDRVQLEFDTDWSVYYNDKGQMELLYCDENVTFTGAPVILAEPQAINVYDFLNEKTL